MLRVWNLSLVIATFCLTILGTFLTRSGVLNSVHSFTESPIGPWLLGFLALVAAVGIGLIAWRGDQLRAPGKIDSPISRESAFLGNNLLFAGLAFVVLLGTVYPLLAEALQGRRLSVGEPYFNRMTTPLGLALLFLMAVAPALPWRAASGEVLQHRLLIPAWVGALTMVAAVALGAHGITDTVTFGLAAFAVAGIIRQFAVGARARRRATSESWPLASARAVRANPRLYGGLVVHTGIILIAIALVASNTYATKTEVRLNRGESATVAGYRVTYLDSRRSVTGQNATYTARVRVHHGGHDLGVYEPAIKSFPGTTTAIGTPSIKTGLVRDVYLTLISSPRKSGRVTIGVAINPMVVWLWIGGGVVALGTFLALTPSLRRRRPGRAPQTAPAAGEPPVETRPLEEIRA
jgi:cytochrome c-type biogenesis protein CcmF